MPVESTKPPPARLVEGLAPWAARHPYWVIAGFILLTLGPFIDKAIHIDDPLFVWTAEQIQRHPANFYGFAANWFGSVLPMTEDTCNPPLTSYGLAAVMSLFGSGEVPMHVALLLVAFATGAGIYQLAGVWCGRPLTATVLAMATPVFLVSSTTVMCDVPMLAFWIWAMVFWERALKIGGGWYLAAGIFAGLAVLTKYSALPLLPLLPLLGWLRKKRLGWWLWWLAVPAAMIGVFELLTAREYGQGLIAAAAAYANQYRFSQEGGRMTKTVIGLAYLGGCLLPASCFAPFLWRPRFVAGCSLLLFGISASTLLALQLPGLSAMSASEDARWWQFIQMTLMMTGGLHVLILAGAEVWRSRDTVNIIAAAWIGSGFLFAAVLNWTVSARSFLPLVAPAAILLVRRWEFGFPLQRKDAEAQRRREQGRGDGRRKAKAFAPLRLCAFAFIPRSPEYQWLVPAMLSLIISLAVARADYDLAGSARTAARQIAAAHPPAHGKLWFEGHCAFQFYLQRLGGTAVDFDNSALSAGDTLVVPDNNSNLRGPPADAVDLLETREFPVCAWLCTVRADEGAGFYGAGGRLPYAFGAIPSEKYYVYRVRQTFQFAPLGDPAEVSPSPENDRLALATEGAILKAMPDDAATHARLAEILERLGRSRDAVEHYRRAVASAPDEPGYLNNLAWLLATAGEANLRDGTQAVQLARHACELTGYHRTIFIGTLAAAFAEAGRFDDAISMAQKACDNATAQGEADLLQRNQALLELYRKHQAYHEPTMPATGG